MPVYVIDTLKPKNGLDFPVVEAVDVSVEGYSSLADAVTHFATDTAIVSINTALDGKASNSDIANLQRQINQIVISSAAESIVAPEVAQARVGTDGTSYSTLNERITAERNEVNTEFARYFGTETDISAQLSSGRILTTDPINLTPETSTDYLCGVINCSEGEIFHLIGTGASDYRMWAFIDSNNHILSEAESMPDQTTSKDITITAPANAVKLVVNFRTHYVGCKIYTVSGGLYYKGIDDVNERIEAEKSEFDANFSRYFGTPTELTEQLSVGRIATISPMNLTPETDVSSQDYRYGIFNCSENDTFRLIGTGAGTYRMWAFIDSNNVVLSKADAMTDYSVSKDVTITAPANAAKLVVNFRVYFITCAIYKLSDGQYYNDLAGVNSRIGALNNDVVALDDKMDLMLTDKKTMFSDTTLTHGYFVSKSTGELVENPNYIASDYIDVSNTDYITLFNTQQSAYYNSSKVYMGDLGNVDTTLLEETTFALPAGAAYVRCSIYNSREDTAYYKSSGEGYSYAFKMSDIENDAGYIRENTIRIGATREYKTLRAGIKEAIKTKGTKVYVDAGTYDLCEEFAAEIAASPSYQYGISLENDVHIIFSSGAKVEAKYTGENVNVETYFAPFYAYGGNSNFIIENLNIETKNTRYCVHDESGHTTGAYVHKYVNCKMYHDNTESIVGIQYYPQCIGGGLGQYGYIDIEGCKFKSKRGETQRTTLVSYHNNAESNSQSNINVRDCYFADYGTFRVTHYGTSAAVSEAIICNCSCGMTPYIEHEGGSSGPENMSLLAYMNEIRNSEVPVT